MKTNLFRILFMLIALSAISVLVFIAFQMGRLEGALNPAWTAERAMCVSQDVEIRESPTGYVVGDIPAGELVWFFKLDLPFAHVAYYDGSTWLEGTIPAFMLALCGQ